MARKRRKQPTRAERRRKESRFFRGLRGDDVTIIKLECSTVIGTLENRQTPSAVLEVAQNAMGWADHLLEQTKGRIPPEQPIVCTEGCFYCCCLLYVEVTPPEVIHIAEFLQSTLSTSELDSIIGQAAEFVERTGAMNEDERGKSRLPCVLLTDNRCCVYPVRPLLCRSFHSFNAHSCKLAYETGNLDIDVEYYDVPRLIPVSVQLGLMAGLHACGHKANLSLELTRALLIALENPGAAEQWLRGEGVFSPAKKETGLKFSSWFWKKFQPKKGG